jgi:hypothetical protein
MDADDDLACDLEFFACAQRVAAWDVVEPDAPPPPARDRLAALERRVRRLSRRVEARRPRPAAPRASSRRGSLAAWERRALLEAVEQQLAARAFGSFYCWTQFTLVHLQLDLRAVARALAAFCGLGLQAFVLAMALDAKYAAWRERADGPYDDGGRVDWRDRSRHGVGGVPSLVLFPLCFGSLVLALSLRSELHELVVGALLVVPAARELTYRAGWRGRVAWFAARSLAYGVHVARLGLVFLYLRVSAALLGTADGPVDIIVDCLTLVFVLELDNLMRLDASRTLFGRARASANDRARHLGAKLRAIAAATLDAGTSGRRAEARCEHAGVCVQINRWFGTSRPNFEILALGQIEVDSADFWTDRLLSSSSRSAADALDSKHSDKLTLKSI